MSDVVELVFRLEIRLAAGMRDDAGEVTAMVNSAASEDFPGRVHKITWARTSGRLIEVENRGDKLIAYTALELSGLADAAPSFNSAEAFAANAGFLKTLLGSVLAPPAKQLGVDQLFIEHTVPVAPRSMAQPENLQPPAKQVTTSTAMAMFFTILSILFAGLFAFSWQDLKADNKLLRDEILRVEDRLQRKAHQTELRLNSVQTELDHLSSKDQ